MSLEGIVGLVGSTARKVVASTWRALRLDDEGRAEVVTASGTDVDVDLAKVGGKTVLDGGSDGSQSVGGTAGHDEASTQNPVLAGAVATAAEPAAVTEGRLTQLSANLRGWLRTLGDIVRVGGSDIISAGLAGVLPVSGPEADGAAPSARSVLTGGIVRKVLTGLTDTHKQTILVDEDGAQWERSKAYDPASAANRIVGPTCASVRSQDGAPDPVITETNIAAGTYRHPGTGGIPVGDFQNFDIEIEGTDAEYRFFHTLVAGAAVGVGNDITSSVRNNKVSGMSGFSVFATGAALSQTFDLTLAGVNGGFIAIDVTYRDGTNASTIRIAGRY